MPRGKNVAGYTPGDDEETGENVSTEPEAEEYEETEEETAAAGASEDAEEEVEAEEEEEDETPTTAPMIPVARPSSQRAEQTAATGTPEPQIEALHFGDVHYQHGNETFSGTVHFNVATETGRFKYEQLKAAQARRNKRVTALMEAAQKQGIYNPVPPKVHYPMEAPVQ